jgi:hypothetical protein
MNQPRAMEAGSSRGTGRFLRHYVEMVLAMAVGMPVFGVLFVSPLDPLGYRTDLQGHPYVRELLMLAMMTVPMVAFMAYRRHSLRLTLEMVAGMALPALAVIGLTAGGRVPGFTTATLTIWSHAAMLIGMLLAMLYRRSEYSGHHDHAAHHRAHASSAKP